MIFIPISSIEEDLSESDKITEKLPKLLHQLGSPIPCVIGTYLDAIRGDKPEETSSLIADTFWGDTGKPDDVLLCSPVEYVSAKFVLQYIEDHASKPPSKDVWDEQYDTKYWVR